MKLPTERMKPLRWQKQSLDKDEKIPSPTITAIKNEMRRLLVLRGSPACTLRSTRVREAEVIEAQETSADPGNDTCTLYEVHSNRTSDEPENENTRQGAQRVQPNGAALPP